MEPKRLSQFFLRSEEVRAEYEIIVLKFLGDNKGTFAVLYQVDEEHRGTIVLPCSQVSLRYEDEREKAAIELIEARLYDRFFGIPFPLKTKKAELRLPKDYKISGLEKTIR